MQEHLPSRRSAALARKQVVAIHGSAEYVSFYVIMRAIHRSGTGHRQHWSAPQR